jgi:hypothetical protein
MTASGVITVTVRKPLPERRECVTDRIRHGDHAYSVTFGFDSDLNIKECFCNSPKEGSDAQAFISDSCIAMSLLMQHGMSISDLAETFGENRAEGADEGPPSSPLGAIARAGAAIEKEFRSASIGLDQIPDYTRKDGFVGAQLVGTGVA